MRAISIFGALAVLTVATAGCGDTQTPPAGSVDLALQAAPGVTINVVSYGRAAARAADRGRAARREACVGARPVGPQPLTSEGLQC